MLETICTGGYNTFVLAGATPASGLEPREIAIFAGGCPPASKETTVLAGDIGARQQCGFSKSSRNK
jgi:hypothetical protein